MNGQIKQQFYRPLKGIQSFRLGKPSLPSGLLYLEGNQMPNVAEKCTTCDYYLDRWALSSITHAVWDFTTCNEICYKTLGQEKGVEKNRIWQREKYRRTHIAKYNTTGRKVVAV